MTRADAASGGAQSQGTCFGFSVHSSLPFHYLRDGNEGGALEISAPSQDGPGPDGRLLVEWTPREGRPLHARLYQAGAGYRLWISSGEWFDIDPEAGRIAVPQTPNPILREERLWGIPAALCFLNRGDLAIHAAAVDIDGAAVLLAAPGRFGKTTLAAAFLAAGYRVLSEDQSCLTFSSTPAVIPGPAMLRVRRDVFRHLTLSGARIVAEGEGRVSLALDADVRGDCTPVPVGAVVLLREGGDGARVERLRPPDVVPDLWALSFRIPVEGDWDRCFAGITQLAWRTPVWNLYRPLKIQELYGTVEQIVATCLGNA